MQNEGCPECGGRDLEPVKDLDGGSRLRIECQGCGKRGPVARNVRVSAELQVVQAWRLWNEDARQLQRVQ